MKNISKWTPIKISKWHIKNLSWVTREEQILKLALEFNEVRKELGIDKEKWIGEWADAWIVASVLRYRYFQELGWIMMEYIRSLDEYEDIMIAVDVKMDINEKRNWHYNEKTGETRHD